MDQLSGNMWKDVKRLQARIFELQKENSILRSTLSKSSVDFCSRILEFVESLHCDAKLSDVVLKTPDKDLPGHMFVLEARGGVWKVTSEGGSYFINFVSRQSVCEALIFWLYKGEVRNTEDCEFLSELMLLASTHGLVDLIQQCEIFIIPLLNRRNCIDLYSIAHQVKGNCLLERASEYLTRIWDSISAPDLHELSPPILLSMLEKQTHFPLHAAIEFGRTDVADLLLHERPIEARSLVNLLNGSGLSPLYLALELDSFDFAEVLIRFGANPNLLIGREEKKQPTGHYALLNGKLSTVEFLIHHGYKVDARHQDSDVTLLHLLTEVIPTDSQKDDHMRVARLILNLGDASPTKDANGNTPLHTAILHRNTSIFQLFIEQPELFDLNATNNLGLPPIWYAVCADFGFNQPGLLHSIGFNPYQYTGKLPCTDFTEQLIRAGADINFRFTVVNAVDSEVSSRLLPAIGDNLLMGCARCALESAASFLLHHGCSTDSESTATPGETEFHLSIESELTNLSRCLATTHKANPNRIRMKSVPCEKPPSPKPVNYPTLTQVVSPIPKVKATKSTNPFDSDSDVSDGPQNPPDSDVLSERMDPDGQGQQVTDPGFLSSIPQNFFLEKRTPLHLAISHGMTELIELYLDFKAGCDPDWFVLDDRGESVFSLCLWAGRFDLAGRILVAANRQYQKQFGSTDFHKSEHDSALELWDSLWSGPTLLHRAIERDHLEAVRFLLRSGVNVNRSLANASTFELTSGSESKHHEHVHSNKPVICPLWCALKDQRMAIAQLLVTHKADVDFWCSYSDTEVQVTLLHHAIHQRKEDAALFLIRNGCDVNSIPRCAQLLKNTNFPNLPDLFHPVRGWSPIHMAAVSDSPSIVRGLINSNRANVNRKDADGNTALHLAVSAGHNMIVSDLLHHPVLDCTLRNGAGQSVFHVAMSCRNINAAQALMERDSTLALQTDNTGRNFLHIALQNLDLPAIFFLIQTGMDMNQPIRDCTQHTPLHVAIVAGVPEDVLLSLILAGASITARTPQKYTPLHLCVVHNRPEMLHALIENGANVNAQDAEMNTPLHLAIRMANLTCLAILLGMEQTDCGIMNVRGQLPVHMLCEHNSKVALTMLQHLLEVRPNASIDVRDAAGDSPLLLAYRADNAPLCIAFHRAGASLGMANANGQTLFKLSRQRTRTAYPDRTLAHILNSITQEPRWEDGSSCSECETKFGLTCRKHHCRHCGRVLCTQCSNYELPIIKFAITKPVRVCETCFEYLNNPLCL